MSREAKRVALVTGASSGIGKDFALQLLREGYMVYGAARRVERMGEIEAGGGVALEMDVTGDLTMTAAVDRIMREQNRIDVLVNNAGYGQMGALEDVPMEAARRQLEVNLIGVARLNQLVLPHMRAQRSGRIVIDTEWAQIAYGSAQEYSAQGAYGPLVASMINLPILKRKMPPPKIITDLLLKALKSKRPRTRYHGGYMAGLILFLKRILPDRMLDRIIMKAIQ
jgi:NAD(P)-dependent dehydrogenase (short-subunit alcohol dehydrogenase family)